MLCMYFHVQECQRNGFRTKNELTGCEIMVVLRAYSQIKSEGKIFTFIFTDISICNIRD